MKKPKNKNTKAYQDWELRRLMRKALKLWASAVKARAGWKCEWCGETKGLNAHHIESYQVNTNLRLALQNGLCLCPGNHKFKKESAHKSFCFTFDLLLRKRKQDAKWLLGNWNLPAKEVTKEYLERRIAEFESIVGYTIDKRVKLC